MDYVKAGLNKIHDQVEYAALMLVTGRINEAERLIITFDDGAQRDGTLLMHEAALAFGWTHATYGSPEAVNELHNRCDDIWSRMHDMLVENEATHGN